MNNHLQCIVITAETSQDCLVFKIQTIQHDCFKYIEFLHWDSESHLLEEDQGQPGPYNIPGDIPHWSHTQGGTVTPKKLKM